jgi:hypothetical protein
MNEQDPKDLVELGALLAGITACALYSRKERPSDVRHVNAQTSARVSMEYAFGGVARAAFRKAYERPCGHRKRTQKRYRSRSTRGGADAMSTV